MKIFKPLNRDNFYLFEEGDYVGQLREIIYPNEIKVDEAIVVTRYMNMKRILLWREGVTIIEGEGNPILIESLNNIPEEIENKYEVVYLEYGAIKDNKGNFIRDKDLFCEVPGSLLSDEYKEFYLAYLLKELGLWNII